MFTYISAAGHGTRIRKAMDGHGFESVTKHLLPTGEPGGQTLVGRNIRLARAAGHSTVLVVGPHNRNVILEHPDIAACQPDAEALVRPDKHHMGVFAFFEQAVRSDVDYALGVDGDVFLGSADLGSMTRAHRHSGRAITFLACRADAPAGEMVFDTDRTGKITALRKLSEPEVGVLCNIGAYAVTVDDQVKTLTERYADPEAATCMAAQHHMCAELVSAGKAGVFEYYGQYVNVNTWEDYLNVLSITQHE